MRSPVPRCASWQPNLFVYEDSPQGIEAIVRSVDGRHRDARAGARFPQRAAQRLGHHRAQSRAELRAQPADGSGDRLRHLLGPAGSGKTLLALAAGLTQTLERNRFVEIIMTRVTIPLGEDIGFLPGTEEEKMEPWMGALMDNLEVLTRSEEGGNWGRAATNDLLRNRIKIRSLNFMRGRTFLNRFIILDEAQNLTPKQMKALVTRAGPGSKLVCLGNIAQIDTPYLTETTSGLTYVVNRFRGWPHSGQSPWCAVSARAWRITHRISYSG